MTWHNSCVIYKDVCHICGAPVLGGSDNGTLTVPAVGQVAECLRCVVFGREEAETAALPAASEARAEGRRSGEVFLRTGGKKMEDEDLTAEDQGKLELSVFGKQEKVSVRLNKKNRCDDQEEDEYLGKDC